MPTLNPDKTPGTLFGPYRVYPGRLSVARTIGDIEAKVPKYGGNPKVVIPIPEIRIFSITNEHDFIVMSSDGIFDKLTNAEVVQTVWDCSSTKLETNIHKQAIFCVESVMKNAIMNKTMDNITCVMICFSAFKERFFQKQKNNIVENQQEVQTGNQLGFSKYQFANKYLQNTKQAVKTDSVKEQEEEDERKQKDEDQSLELFNWNQKSLFNFSKKAKSPETNTLSKKNQRYRYNENLQEQQQIQPNQNYEAQKPPLPSSKFRFKFNQAITKQQFIQKDLDQ